MNTRTQKAAALANFSRFNPGSSKGFYESFFVRANHPDKAKAFWIRYTLFSPQNRPEDSIAELWVIYFDGASIYPSKSEFPLANCSFPRKNFEINIEGNYLNSAKATGQSTDISWDLTYHSHQPPLFLLPLSFYNAPFPKAKSIVSQPFAVFDGLLNVQGKSIEIEGWKGSQNHNWGLKHTDFYAWGQVVGFDNSPDTLLEVVTAKVKIAGMTTPYITLMVLYHKGRVYELNDMTCWLQNKGEFDYFKWDFECKNDQIKVKGQITAAQTAFVGLNYKNPVGGSKNCLNSKLASCSIEIIESSQMGMPQSLYTEHRCAFEILTNEGKEKHGITINF